MVKKKNAFFPAILLLHGVADPRRGMFVAAQDEAVSSTDGLRKSFVKRAVKAAAASLLSETGKNFSSGRRDEAAIELMKDEFTEDAIMIQYFEQGKDEGVDDAIFIEDEGMCFVAFQSTTSSLKDIGQNLNLKKEDVCNKQGECCKFREGFVNGWETQYKSELVDTVAKCVDRCNLEKGQNSDRPCLVITGHSQGGAIATVASLELSDVTSNYEVITFAAPPSLMTQPDDCKAVETDKHFRFGKGLYKTNVMGGVTGLVFDGVSFLGPGAIPGLQTYSVGHFIVLSSEDHNNVAEIGLNTNEVLRPWDATSSAHVLYTADDFKFPGTGYYNILRSMRDHSKFPIKVEGFQNGKHCGSVDHAGGLCSSGRCDRARGEIRPTCKAKLQNGEKCNQNDDCMSSRCDPKGGNPLNKICHNQTADGEGCNEDSDCLSGRCTLVRPRKCKALSGPGGRCVKNEHCIDGYYCPAGLDRKCKKERMSN